jgi:integrase
MTLSDFLRTTYVPLRLRGRSPESVRLLEHAVRQFSRWLGRPAVLEDFDDLTVSQFLAHRGTTLSPLSVARERSGLLAIWNLAQARGLLRLRPCVMPELIPERMPRAFTADELTSLYRSCGEAKGWVGPVPAATWFRALCATLFCTGERITAILRVPRDCWRRPWLDVPAACRKGGRKAMLYQLPPDVADLVDAASRHDGPSLLWWPASDTALRKRWHRITKRAGLGDGRDVQFHALRKSYASHLEAAGGDAREGLGHSSESVTRKYLDPRITHAARPADWQRLPQIWQPPPDDDSGEVSGVA